MYKGEACLAQIYQGRSTKNCQERCRFIDSICYLVSQSHRPRDSRDSSNVRVATRSAPLPAKFSAITSPQCSGAAAPSFASAREASSTNFFGIGEDVFTGSRGRKAPVTLIVPVKTRRGSESSCRAYFSPRPHSCPLATGPSGPSRTRTRQPSGQTMQVK